MEELPNEISSSINQQIQFMDQFGVNFISHGEPIPASTLTTAGSNTNLSIGIRVSDVLTTGTGWTYTTTPSLIVNDYEEVMSDAPPKTKGWKSKKKADEIPKEEYNPFDHITFTKD